MTGPKRKLVRRIRRVVDGIIGNALKPSDMDGYKLACNAAYYVGRLELHPDDVTEDIIATCALMVRPYAVPVMFDDRTQALIKAVCIARQPDLRGPTPVRIAGIRERVHEPFYDTVTTDRTQHAPLARRQTTSSHRLDSRHDRRRSARHSRRRGR